MSTKQSDEPRINEQITEAEVRLVGAEGEMLGVVPLQEALQKANHAGLDLVEVAAQASPPVCKIMDYGKYKYETQKKANEARKKQKTSQVKEIKMRLTIDSHDFDVKIRKIKEFIDHGDKVKITIRFRGRERSHMEKADELVARIKKAVNAYAKFDQEAKMEGNFMGMMLSPLK